MRGRKKKGGESCETSLKVGQHKSIHERKGEKTKRTIFP